MKANTRIVMSAVATLAVTLSMQAQEKADPPRTETPRTTPTTQRDLDQGRAQQVERLGQVVKASEVIGKDLKNLQDEKIGKIEDLAVDMETGRILEVFVASGGVLGIGEKVTAVPPSAFKCEAPHPTLRLDSTKEKLKAAPAFELSKWDDATGSNRVAESYRYFGKEPYYVSATRRADDRTAMAPGRMERASKVIGASVRNEADEKLGSVDNLMVDLEAGRIVHVILSSGGFLGVGDDLRAVPPSVFRVRENDNVLVVNASKDSLTSAPRFKASEWPDFSEPGYSAGVYRAHRVDPYFTTDADNTRRNVRDRNDRTLTPLDQGTSEADINTTRQIRKAILDRDGLSVNAKNVKVITVNGRVTLRGPVSNAAESRTLEEIAQRAAPGTKVDNQLEVKQLENR